jgi:hypothetical protein
MTQHTDKARFPTATFTVADPRTFEGDPYEVAERALKQAAAVAGVLAQMIDAADKMARNAEMERAFANHEEPKGSDWPNTPQGKILHEVETQSGTIANRLTVLARAAGYNPKRPPKA